MASKTIDHKNLYVAIAEYEHKSVPDQTFNCLRVYVSYRKGWGFTVGFHPGWGDDRCWGCMMGIGDEDPLTAGFDILAIPATMNSVKKLQAIYDNLNAGPARKIIAWLFDQRKWETLRMSLEHIATKSDWATEELLQSMMKPAPAKEPIVKQVDVMALMGALQTTGHAKLSDFAKPIESHNGDSSCVPTVASEQSSSAHCETTEVPEVKQEPKAEEPSPGEAEFRRRKEKSGGATLIIRQTYDYYWLLFEDAEEAATILPLAKEQLPCGGRLIPRIRFHHTKLDRYLPMLIRAGKRVAICEKITNNNNESNLEDENMRLNLNANQKTNESVNVAMQPQVNNNPIEDAVAEEIKDVEVAEVQDIVPVATPKPAETPAETKAETPAVSVPLGNHGTLVVTGMPKRDKSGKFVKKSSTKDTKSVDSTKPDPEAVGELAGMLTKVSLVVYKTKKGNDAPMIVGFSGEDDERWKKLHEAKPKWVSAGYRKNDEGTKQYHLMFGSRYMAVAKALCEVYNTTDKAAWDKAEQACAGCYDGIVSGFKAEREARRAEKRAAGITTSPSPTGEGSKKTYTNEDVAAMLRKVLAGGNVPEDIERLLKAA